MSSIPHALPRAVRLVLLLAIAVPAAAQTTAGSTGGWMDLTDDRINRDLANGDAAVLDADTARSTERFSVGRVVRLGGRLRF